MNHQFEEQFCLSSKNYLTLDDMEPTSNEAGLSLGCYPSSRVLAEENISKVYEETYSMGICLEMACDAAEILPAVVDFLPDMKPPIANEPSSSLDILMHTKDDELEGSAFTRAPLILSSAESIRSSIDPASQSASESMSFVLPGTHTCMICQQTFSNHKTLFCHCLVHPLIHIVEFGPPACGICKMVFRDVVELHHHVQEEAELVQVNVEESNGQINSSSVDLPSGLILASLKNVINIKPDLEETGLINIIFDTDNNSLLDNHNRNIRNEGLKNGSSIEIRKSKEGSTRKRKLKEKSKAEDKSYVCSQCCRSFVNAQGLLCHIKMHIEGKPFKCLQCGDSFRFAKRLSIHARIFHDVPLCSLCGLGDSECLCAMHLGSKELGENSCNYKKPFSCLRCKKSFARIKALQKHELTHMQTTVHICDICGKRFHDRSQFSRHLAHHNGTVHQCQACQKVFGTDVILRDHMKTHSNERPISCNICGKHFKWRNALRMHLNKHYGTTYQCDVCGRDFTTKSYLMTHVEMHTGSRVRSHKCNLCDKAYFDKSALRKHRATHAIVRDRPFGCKICGKSFLANNNLTTHLKLHLNERPYKCDICGKSFKMKGHLKRHQTIHSKSTGSHLPVDESPVLLFTENDCQETCEEIVIDSVVTIV